TRNADPVVQIDVARVEAFAQYSKTNIAEAKQILEDTLRRFPEQDESYRSLSQLYVSEAQKLTESGNAPAAGVQLTNAMKVIENQLKSQPQNASAHFHYGALLMFVKDFDGAAAQFTRVLELQKENSAAPLNRAIANFQGKKIDAAKRDYQDMLSRFTTTDFRVYYGLGEIAYLEKDWKAARENYQQYLRYAPPNASEAKLIRERLDEVKRKS
ncbi:MAG TPA: tetratricopeptide repeat protein, partial [Candidatus Limnocylindria bacterium]|nr:tetratricopeptide repeat protein [Candidatus Limnocylindria bacterium]